MRNQIYTFLPKSALFQIMQCFSFSIANFRFNNCAIFRITIASLCAAFIQNWHFWWRHNYVSNS